MTHTNDQSTNSKSNSINKVFSSSMGVETLNDSNTTSWVSIFPDSSPVVISYSSESDDVSSKSIFGEDFSYESSTLFYNESTRKFIGDDRCDNVVHAF